MLPLGGDEELQVAIDGRTVTVTGRLTRSRHNAVVAAVGRAVADRDAAVVSERLLAIVPEGPGFDATSQPPAQGDAGQAVRGRHPRPVPPPMRPRTVRRSAPCCGSAVPCRGHLGHRSSPT